MSGFREQIIARAKTDKQTIVLPEGSDKRTLEAARDVIDQDIADVIILGSEEEIAAIRADQESRKENPGIYGKYAKYRDASIEEVKEHLEKGEIPVMRFKSNGDPSRYFEITDAIRGKISMPENTQDVVILKQIGLPTYHFAHVVDDHFMRTTHVVRGEEWLPSLPIHVQLFDAMGWEYPIFCHNTVLMKVDEETGQKRKLSKRKDPELGLSYYKQMGYFPEAVREYLMTILNSDYEEWRIANPLTDYNEFNFLPSKMSNSGTMFDLNKLVNYKLSNNKLYHILTWLKPWIFNEIRKISNSSAHQNRIKICRLNITFKNVFIFCGHHGCLFKIADDFDSLPFRIFKNGGPSFVHGKNPGVRVEAVCLIFTLLWNIQCYAHQCS